MVASLPVYMRIGPSPETEIGTIDLTVQRNSLLGVSGPAIAEMLRAAADAFANLGVDEEVPDAAS